MRILIFLIAAATCSSCFSQKSYNQYVVSEGLKLSTRWSTAKDETGQKKRALLMGIENTNRHDVVYSFKVNFYYEGILRETAGVDNECLPGLKSRIGKLNGVYFIPARFTEEQLKSSDFNFTVEDVVVEKSDQRCATLE